MLRYALTNLLRHIWRTLATVLGIGVGVAAILGTITVGHNIEHNLSAAFSKAAGQAGLVVTPGGGIRGELRVARAEAAIARSPASTQILRVVPTLQDYAVLANRAAGYHRPIVPGLKGGFLLYGEPALRASRQLSLEAGKLPAGGSGGIAITQHFARSAQLGVGRTLYFVTALGQMRFQVTGILRNTLGVAELNAGQVGVTDLRSLQRATALAGRASYLSLILKPGTNAAALRRELQRSLPRRYAVVYPAVLGNVSNGLLQTLQSGLEVLAATLMALAGFLAYNTFAAAVVERSREFALLRTLGFTKRQLIVTSVVEALCVSLVGVAVGIGLGALLASAITDFNSLLLRLPVAGLSLPWPKIALAGAIGTLTALAAASGPARAAARVTPLEASRQAYSAGEGGRWPLGLLLLALGLALSFAPWSGQVAMVGATASMTSVFLGVALVTPSLIRPVGRALLPLIGPAFRAAARIGLSSAERSRGRNAVAISAVALGIALVLGVGGMVSGINSSVAQWVHVTVAGDMFVAAAVPFPKHFQKLVEQKVPAIVQTTPISVRMVRFKPPGQPSRVATVIFSGISHYDPSKGGNGRFEFIQGNLAGSLPGLYSGHGVMISQTISDRFGLGVGDSVQLRSEKGWTSFHVVGVDVDYSSAGESFVLSIHDLGLFGGGRPGLYILSLHPGSKAAAIRAADAALKKAFPKLYLNISYTRAYRRQILTVTQRFFTSTDSLLLLAILVASLGVANTLGMNLSERMHEMAVLRAIGLTKGGLLASIVAEGILIVVLGSFLGLLAGLALSHAVTTAANSLTGYRVEPVYPLLLFAGAAISSPLIGLLASLLPARRALAQSPALAIRRSE